MHLGKDHHVEYRGNGLEIYSHPSPFGDRWYSVYIEHGDPIRRDIPSYEEAEDVLFDYVEMCGTGDDEILGAIGADVSYANVDRAIKKEIKDITRSGETYDRPGMGQILKGGPISTKEFMGSMGLGRDNISRAFGSDMTYVRNLTNPNGMMLR